MKKKPATILTDKEQLIEKILDRTVLVLIEEALGDCWVWVARMNRNGYGRIHHDGNEKVAHRVTYETMVGEIPEGLILDHRCKVRCCVNPAHLEPVTHQENTLRGEAKLFGRDIHPYTQEILT